MSLPILRFSILSILCTFSTGLTCWADVEINLASGTAVGDGTLGTLPSQFSSVGGTLAFPTLLNGSAQPAAVVRSMWWGLEAIAQQGQSAVGNGQFQGFGEVATNYNGHVAFTATSITGTVAGAEDDTGLFLQPAPVMPAITGQFPVDAGPPFSLETQPLKLLAREGQALPGSTSLVFRSFAAPKVSEKNEVTFRASYATAGAPSIPDDAKDGLFVSAANGLRAVALSGQEITDSTASLKLVGAFTPYDTTTDSCVIVGQLENTPNGTADDTALLRGNGTSLQTLASEGAAAPGGDFFDLIGTPIMVRGRTAFHASLRTTQGMEGNPAGQGIYEVTSANILGKVVRSGEPSPNAGGAFLTFGTSPHCSSTTNGTTKVFAFTATRDNAASPSGVFLSKNNLLTTIASQNQTTPEGRGTFHAFHEIAVGVTGVVVFAADVLDQGQMARGVYLHDGTSLTLLARTGDNIEGRTLLSIAFAQGSFNDAREFSMSANFVDGGNAILLHAPQTQQLARTFNDWGTASYWSTGAVPGAYSHAMLDLPAGLVIYMVSPTSYVALRSFTLGDGIGVSALRSYDKHLFVSKKMILSKGMHLVGGSGRFAELTNHGFMETPAEVMGNFTQSASGYLFPKFVKANAGSSNPYEIHNAMTVRGEVSLDGQILIPDPSPSALRFYSPGQRHYVLRHGAGKRTGFFSNAPDGATIWKNDNTISAQIHYTDTGVYFDNFQGSDIDEDGIPDTWMKYYFTHLDPRESDRTRAEDDWDGDGMSNQQEYLADTNPKLTSSALRANAIADATTLSIRFPSRYPREYVIESSSDLNPESWTPVHTEIFGTDQNLTYPLPGAYTEEKHFYRVRLVTE